MVGEAVVDVQSETLRHAVAQITQCLAQFTRRSIDLLHPYRREDGAGANASEAQLQDELFEFIKYTYQLGISGYEPQKLAGGRADISVTIANEIVLLECKKEKHDAFGEALQAAYAGQGGSYAAAEHPFGVVVVLDLTAKQVTSQPVFRESLWIYRQPPDDGGKTLLFVRVAGRRVTPSELSSSPHARS